MFAPEEVLCCCLYLSGRTFTGGISDPNRLIGVQILSISIMFILSYFKVYMYYKHIEWKHRMCVVGGVAIHLTQKNYHYQYRTMTN